jgi:hypothetical protein
VAGCAWATVAVGFQLGFQLGYPAAPGRGYHQITVQRVVGDPNAGTTLTTSPAARPVTSGPTDSIVPAASRALGLREIEGEEVVPGLSRVSAAAADRCRVVRRRTVHAGDRLAAARPVRPGCFNVYFRFSGSPKALRLFRHFPGLALASAWASCRMISPYGDPQNAWWTS